ncbi:valine--tRNA ligase [Petrimonas sulfuriphila]|jgi:valyl-tRNA synthetase|uniref:valine--tRNA ligase n=1 Tax=Petrimonas sulfuriphila TaxID=285070 RepID=UPI000E880A4F|nr:valine--tRNA ligase [Petrimonas sp.]BBD44076.1 valyl-tRNA synthetase [Petrimonas sp. IBARAKI]HBK42546.1 valine--tRNA ligase [Porphyromonadaceae bacterium]MDX9775615.1 valine--tRNA ligase [Petrimonas sp.]HBK95767.1 valine--tRNA ligase [Porphyromonadaceae bacterium]
MEISSKYNPAEVEDKWYSYWMEHKLFRSKPDEREPYTIVIPPPNVTGILHMGHMLNNTIQDILIRRARMEGKNACWVPGTDHASIATEAKVVAKLAAEGIKKSDLTREEFLSHAWEWTHKHGGMILEQLKKLGASCDWDRTCFTMDEKRSESVINVFVDLYNKGLVYRGVRMVNWDPQALTALSDEEVVHKEVNGKLYYLRYKIEGEEAYAVVATTRPETIMGDTAMCIHPDNPKTAHLKGKKVIVPLIGRVIPVIEDEYVDMEFGTGCLKVTPAHDVNDYVLGEKYNLPSIDIFNDNGTLNENGAMYAGKDRFEVRKLIEKDLENAGLIEKTEPYTNKVGFSERTNVAIEPKLSMQWFLKMEDIAKPALDAVENDTIKFHPVKYKNTYRHWMENIKDWCISRQLWWGHQIPAYYLPKGGVVVAVTKEEAYQKALQTVDYPLTIDDLRQDEDCLDTWFSSWLWPISVFDGINQPDNPDISYYYPTNDLVTGPDIIFFWVARMIMAGYEYRQSPCFSNVYFTGIVRDIQGRKMSKQLGNSPDPIELMARHGADGVRMGMLLASSAGNDLLFDESLCEQGRNFNNKIWNAFRLVKGWEVNDTNEQPETAKIAINWFGNVLSKTIVELDDLFSKYRLSEALMMVYKLFWDEFSSWYLELVKPAYRQPIDRATYQATLAFFDSLLRLLHPFMPFITEELWQALNERKPGESITIAQQPKANRVDEKLIADFEITKQIIAGIRTIRLQKNIPNKDELTLQVIGNHDSRFDTAVAKMANLSSIENLSEKPAVTIGFLVGTTEFIVPMSDKMDVEAELKKMKAEREYYAGFLQSVMKKLGNERFVQNAKPEIVENERKKQADAESKIALLEESIKALEQ